jgi:hypothetical protein
VFAMRPRDRNREKEAGTMGNQNRTMRTVLQWTHLLVAWLIGVLVYTPMRGNGAFVLLVQAVSFP